MKRRGWQERDLEAARGGLSRPSANQLRELRKGLRFQIGHDLGKLAAGKEPVVQQPVPLFVELVLAEDRCPGLAHDLVPGTILAAHHDAKHFDCRPSAEQGKDQRLDDAERTSNGARVAPRFEIVRTRNVPLRLDRGFIDRVPERDRLGHLRHRRSEVEVGGGIEHGIAAQDDQRLNCARLHRGDE